VPIRNPSPLSLGLPNLMIRIAILYPNNLVHVLVSNRA